MEKFKSIKTRILDGVLFLQGVFKKDYRKIEDIFQDRLMGDITNETKIYDKLPVIFTSLQTWPKSTNLKCWNCSLGFKTRPWFEPQSIEPISEGTIGNLPCQTTTSIKKSISVPTKGCFCSANCVAAYISLHTKSLSEQHNKMSMLKYIYEIFTGKLPTYIHPSPSPTELIQYGGDITESEYRQKIEALDVTYKRELEENNFSNICQVYASKFME